MAIQTPPNDKPPETFTAAFLRLVWGKRWAPYLIVAVIAASGLIALWEIFKPSPERKGPTDTITFSPIENRDELIKTFSIDSSSPSISLSFKSSPFKLNLRFVVSQNVTVEQLMSELRDHFDLARHLHVDNGQESFGQVQAIWVLMRNGLPFDGDLKKTLKDAGFHEGDVLRFRLTWAMQINLSGPSGDPHPFRLPPPDIDL